MCSIFSSDETVLGIFESIRYFLALTVFFMCVSDTMESVMIAQGTRGLLNPNSVAYMVADE
jgi:hypothetical protein